MSNRSNFPDSIDTFVEHRELSVDEVTKANRWRELRVKDNKTSSEIVEFNTLTMELSDAFLTSEDVNKLQDCVIALETFFRDNVDDYLDEFQGNFNFLGEWDSSVEYSKFNTVTYGGNSYICLQPNNNQEPSLEGNTVYWGMIAEKGDTGVLDIKKYDANVGTINEGDSDWAFSFTTTDTGMTGEEEMMVFVNGQNVPATTTRTENGFNLTISSDDIALKSNDKLSITAFDTVPTKTVNKINVTIQASDWGSGGVYKYENDKIKVTSCVDVIFNNYVSLERAVLYGVANYTKEHDGYVEIYATETPELPMSATIIIND